VVSRHPPLRDLWHPRPRPTPYLRTNHPCALPTSWAGKMFLQEPGASQRVRRLCQQLAEGPLHMTIIITTTTIRPLCLNLETGQCRRPQPGGGKCIQPSVPGCTTHGRLPRNITSGPRVVSRLCVCLYGSQLISGRIGTACGRFATWCRPQSSSAGSAAPPPPPPGRDRGAKGRYLMCNAFDKLLFRGSAAAASANLDARLDRSCY